ncbi:hypothetical protein [Motilibacter deserti]|uniref:Uncharacterized protein n=1 Tax=Motilibacter deserti TaxID=2714956 RepID=A0ABX0GU43_9ACTN|nr:hypothetical protein [Motilibacter deserti]NHC13175.1 hypothetical protein [Motilibacter deserti]
MLHLPAPVPLDIEGVEGWLVRGARGSSHSVAAVGMRAGAVVEPLADIGLGHLRMHTAMERAGWEATELACLDRPWANGLLLTAWPGRMPGALRQLERALRKPGRLRLERLRAELRNEYDEGRDTPRTGLQARFGVLGPGRYGLPELGVERLRSVAGLTQAGGGGAALPPARQLGPLPAWRRGPDGWSMVCLGFADVRTAEAAAYAIDTQLDAADEDWIGSAVVMTGLASPPVLVVSAVAGEGSAARLAGAVQRVAAGAADAEELRRWRRAHDPLDEVEALQLEARRALGCSLLGLPVLSASELEAARAAVLPEDVAAAAGHAVAHDAVWVLPGPPPPALEALPEWRAQPVDGQSWSRHGGQRLRLGEAGVTVEAERGERTVRWDECAAVVRTTEGWTLVGDDGERVVVVPREWRDGDVLGRRLAREARGREQVEMPAR